MYYELIEINGDESKLPKDAGEYIVLYDGMELDRIKYDQGNEEIKTIWLHYVHSYYSPVTVEDWVSVDTPPIAYKQGKFDGLQSELVLTINKKGKHEIALTYQGEMDGNKFCDWYDKDDFEIEKPLYWRKLPTIINN